MKEKVKREEENRSRRVFGFNPMGYKEPVKESNKIKDMIKIQHRKFHLSEV
jgi:hypothetical protein